MIILNEVYTVLKERLKDVKNIKRVDWFNNQYNNMDDEKATRYPAVYIEFINPINWNQSGNKYQYATCTIRLHCVLFDIRDSPLRALKFGQLIFEEINSKALYDDNKTQLTSELVRRDTTFPTRYNQLKVVEMDFECEVYDTTGMPQLKDVANVDFIINP